MSSERCLFVKYIYIYKLQESVSLTTFSNFSIFLNFVILYIIYHVIFKKKYKIYRNKIKSNIKKRIRFFSKPMFYH